VATFGMATPTKVDFGADAVRKVDTDDLRDQLQEIRDSLDPLLSDSGRGLSLNDVEIALTLSASARSYSSPKAE
jgi:hypothetical protein